MQGLAATKFNGAGRQVTGEVFIRKRWCPQASGEVKKGVEKRKRGPGPAQKQGDVVIDLNG